MGGVVDVGVWGGVDWKEKGGGKYVLEMVGE